ncbi:CaiB/BaiF CoA transferase family protein [Rhodococcus jostii]|uniref:Crotonobetainyl-CoA:carnitine CoA-transferase CaiB n=1 Tax=Rhodococcus jostii TaxID=132919 RepID=A0A1H5C2L3_RHOJO|nr:CoA transferase [Rhodococcus jostii]SED60701.1 Crotonobetainyl-CoA:carnitine CoA-transferase CaiB [Rhodococcus jostii]
MSTNRNGGPLSGIRVLDLGQYIAGPSAGQTLADLGASVLKVESLRGDQARRVGVFGEAMVRAYNRDKDSIALDLGHPEARTILHRLLADTDVLVQNFRSGSAERLGIGPEELRRRYPRLVYASVTGFGSEGPSRTRPGLDIAAQAEFGLMHATGAADGAPQRLGFPAADVTAANALATGILAALYERESTGRGAHVETSLMEAVLSVQSTSWGEYTLTGDAPRRRGNGQAHAAPAADVIRVADGMIVLSAYTSEKWSALCHLVGRPDMIGDLRFVDNAARVEHRAELLSTLGDAFAGMTRDQAVALLSSAQIVCGAIRSFDDVVEDKDVLASGILVEVAASEGDSFTSPGLAFTLDGRRRTSSAAAPAVGRDTVPVLEQLGFTDDEISRLFDGHVVAGATSHRTTSKGTRS